MPPASPVACRFAEQPPAIDGTIDDPAWKQVATEHDGQIWGNDVFEVFLAGRRVGAVSFLSNRHHVGTPK